MREQSEAWSSGWLEALRLAGEPQSWELVPGVLTPGLALCYELGSWGEGPGEAGGVGRTWAAPL